MQLKIHSHSPQHSAFEVKNFFPARTLRHHYESIFADPLRADRRRFVFDPWLIKNQYALLRTPALPFFEKKLTPFLMELSRFGLEYLGCQHISEPWLSLYLEGHYQNLHTDVPHGPWSFVYSLNPKKILFQGGQTQIATETLTRVHLQKNSHQSHESNHFFKTFSNPVASLTVFDPSYPHGVSQTRGTLDPLEGRLVIHGWFMHPTPSIIGNKPKNEVQRTIEHFENVTKHCVFKLNAKGFIAIRINYKPNRKTPEILLISQTLKKNGSRLKNREIQTCFNSILKQTSPLIVPNQNQPFTLNLPLTFI